MKLKDFIAKNSNDDIQWILFTLWNSNECEYYAKNVFKNKNMIPANWLNFQVVTWRIGCEGIVVCL